MQNALQGAVLDHSITFSLLAATKAGRNSASSPPQSRAGGDPLHSVGGPMLACTGWPPPRKSSRYALLWLWVQDCPSQPSQNSPSLMTTLLALVEGQLRAPRGISKPCPGRPAQRSDSMPHPGGQRTLAHGLGAMTCSSPWLRPSPR
jgi:hypothetical protein